MKKKNTDELLSILNNTDSMNQLEHYVDTHLDIPLPTTLGKYLEEYIQEHGLHKSDIIKESGLVRTYAYQIFQDVRLPGRDKVIALCLSMTMPLVDIQRALSISENGSLHPRRKRDAIIIFAIKKQLNVFDTNLLLYDMKEEPLS